jgi:hypothetical protein
MPEHAYTPPETKYEVHIDELMKAIKGEPFEQGNGLWRMKGKEIDRKELFGDDNIYFSETQKYIVLTQAIVTNADAIELITDSPTNYDIGFIFHKSILPGIRLRNTQTTDWYYHNSRSTYISLDCNCQAGDMRICNNSQAGYIIINNNSQAGHIIINNNSQAEKIRIDQDSQSGDIMVDNNSQTGDISIHSKSKTGNIGIENKSQVGTIWIDKDSQAAIIRVYQSSKSGNIRIENNSIARNIGIDSNSKVDNIQVSGNSKARHIRIENNSQAGNVEVFGKSQMGDIWIKSHSQVGNININNSHSGDIWINNHSHLVDIWVDNNSHSGDIRIDKNSHSSDIGIYKNSHSGDIRIEDNSQSDNIWIYKNSQSGNIRIYKNKTAFVINITGNSQTGNLDFTDALLSHIRIEQNCFGLSLYNTQFLLMQIAESLITTLDWQAGTKGELYISQSQLLHLQVANTSLLKDSLLSLSDTQLQYGVLQEVLVQGNLLLRKVGQPKSPADEWKKELWNNKKTLLEQQKKNYDDKVTELAKQYGPDPIFRITHSSLGKTEITGCDFSAFQFQYYNSNLLGCFITGTQLPKRNMVIYDPVADTVLNNQSHSNVLFEQKTAIYNQFKKIYENQGDVVEASVFHAQAMHWQQKLLWRQFRHDKEGFWKKVKLFFENIGFRLNWFSNNHGESWLVALVFTIGVGLVFFTASIWGLTHWGDFKTLNDHIHKLPGFMLPTHSYDYLSKDIVGTTQSTYPNLKVNLWHTSWDFLGRIFVGYGIFQFISAFRRHGKKGG